MSVGLSGKCWAESDGFMELRSEGMTFSIRKMNLCMVICIEEASECIDHHKQIVPANERVKTSWIKG